MSIVVITVFIVSYRARQIYAALFQWRTGQYIAVEFASKMFVDCYRGHLGTLDSIEVNNPGGYHDLMSDIYRAIE